MLSKYMIIEMNYTMMSKKRKKLYNTFALFQKDTVDFEFLDHFKISAKKQNSEVIARTYFRINKDRSDSKKISEKDY